MNRLRHLAFLVLIAWVFSALALHAQQPMQAQEPMASMAPMVMTAQTLIEAEQKHGSSGTSIEPASTAIAMLMMERGSGANKWRLMLHANAFAANTQQQASRPRNRDAFFSTNWIMPMAQRAFGDGGRGGQLTLRTMFSFEPGTMSRRNYPELFQQGETAYGAPIVDGQHPHDFLMELAALYDLPLSKNALLSFYAAPVGDPAMGPTAYPHRASASEDPIAALGHHQQDSTHIAFNVLTGGLTYRWVRGEVSGFHGGEPSEAHWHFQPSSNGHAIDSVSGRVTVSPTPDWTGQYSIGHIESPEALYPGEAQQRQTASMMYHHTFRSQPMAGVSMAGMSMPAPAAAPPRPAAAPAKAHDMAGMDMADMPGMDMSPKPAAAPPATHPPPTPPASHSGMQMSMASGPATDLSATLLWGRTRSLHDGSKENSYLAEALLRFASANYVWTRLENAGRSNELLLTPRSPLPPNFTEEPIGHVAAFTLGYDHDFRLGPHLLAAPGAQLTVYRAPRALRSTYGTTPTGEVFFVRFRLR